MAQGQWGGEQGFFQGLDVGDVLSTSARVIGQRFVPLAIIVVICMSPAMVLQLGLMLMPAAGTEKLATEQTGVLASVLGVGAAVGVLQFVLTYVSQGAVMYLTVEQLAGRGTLLADSVRHAFSRVLWIIVTALVAGLLVLLGTMACVVPGIILGCMFYVAVPVTIVEKIGPLRSLNRSSELTSGYRWRVFLLLVIVAVLGGVMTLSAGLVSELLVVAVPGTAGQIANLPLEWAATVLQTIVAATVVAVTYARLRAVREGIDAVTLAQVFA
jgi:hypothetical protein